MYMYQLAILDEDDGVISIDRSNFIKEIIYLKPLKI